MMSVPACGRRPAIQRTGFLAVLLTGAGLAGCAVGPDYHTPKEQLPGEFDAIRSAAQLRPSSANIRPPGATSTAAASSPDSTAVDLANWWQALRDTELESLIDRAVKANPDLQIALDRLQAARTYEIAVAGSLLPDAQASGAVARGTGSDLTRGRADQSLVSADSSSGLQHINQIGGFDSVWEIDLFGKYRREMQAARFDARAAAARRNAVLTTVISDVARAYVNMRALQMRAAVLRAAIDTMRQSQNVVRQRYERGITNELDLTLANRELGVIESLVAPVQAQVSAAQYAIATLLGLYPEDLAAELAAPAMIPAVPSVVQSGLPVDLLKRRPEILQAQMELAASTAQVGVATANLFPQISISAAIGFQKQINPAIGQHIWSAGPAAVWPLLDFGALDAQVEVADLRTRALLVSYKATIQNAVKDVDTAWTGFAAQQERLARLGDALEAAQRAVTLANERYVRGLTDALNLVDAQRQEYELEEQYTDAQLGVAEDFIALYRSLGGGWENFQSLPPVHVPQPAVLAVFHRVLNRNEALQ